LTKDVRLGKKIELKTGEPCQVHAGEEKQREKKKAKWVPKRGKVGKEEKMEKKDGGDPGIQVKEDEGGHYRGGRKRVGGSNHWVEKHQ